MEPYAGVERGGAEAGGWLSRRRPCGVGGGAVGCGGYGAGGWEGGPGGYGGEVREVGEVEDERGGAEAGEAGAAGEGWGRGRGRIRRGAARVGRRVVVGLAVVALVVPVSAGRAAQTTLPDDVKVLSANVLLGGLTCGIAALFRGEPFLEAFEEGALGGSLQYVGKRLMTLRIPGAGLAGRMVGATGASVVRNGAEGGEPFDLVVLPFGPLMLHWSTSPDSGGVEPKLHVGRTIFLARLLLNEDLRLDWGETLSAGAPVFVARDRVLQSQAQRPLAGVELWGALAISDTDLLPPIDEREILAHERVHVVQDDFLSIAWSDPLEDRLLEGLSFGDVVVRHADLGVVYMGIAGVLMALFPYELRPWEIEAYYMEAGL